MKRLLLALGSALVFSACAPVIVKGGTSTQNLTVSNLTYSSNFQDSTGKSYICDDQPTTLTYGFTVNDFSLLKGWQTALVGTVNSNDRTTTVYTSATSNSFIRTGNRVTVNMSIFPGVAPLSISPQGIVVTPVVQPAIIGASKLELTVFRNGGGQDSITLTGIPVINKCN